MYFISAIFDNRPRLRVQFPAAMKSQISKFVFAVMAAAVAAAALVAIPDAAYAQSRLAILSVAAVPRGAGASQDSAVFEYPEVETLDIQVTVRLDSQSEAKISIFASAVDSNKWRIGKAKITETVSPGESVLTLKDFVKLGQFFGRHDVSLEIEVSAKSFETVRTKRGFSFYGVPKPDFKFVYADLRSRNEPLYIEFLPGEAYELNLFYEIGGNPGNLAPMLRVFAVLDSQNFRIGDASLSDPFWDETDIPGEPGLYHVELSGRLPDRFIDYYRQRHYFKLIVQVEFEGGYEIVEPVEGMIFDEFYGSQREPISIQESFITIQNSAHWRLDALDDRSFDRRIREFRELRRTRRMHLYY